jgi:hypothetical protein
MTSCNMLNTLVIQLNTMAQYNQINLSQATQLIQSSPYSIQAIKYKDVLCVIPCGASNPAHPFMYAMVIHNIERS